LPNLTKLKNLQLLGCSFNKLTSLPTLPQNLKKLVCYGNNLTFLPSLPQNLQKLYCSNNNLTSIPTLPENFKKLVCANNNLTYLPTLPQNITILSCLNNNLTSLPTLPQNIKEVHWVGNPIYEILGHQKSVIEIKKKIQTLNNFRHLYYCLKFKKHFRKWLWIKIREPKIEKMYDPIYLIENLNNWK
jgi:Leucine-rich repeat (LRR) protein